MPLNIYALGQRINQIRKKRGYSQIMLADKVHISATFLSYIENGSKAMSMDTFVEIANMLNTTADDLLKDSLNNTTIISNNALTELMSDCSTFEERVLIDVLISIKQSLRDNRSMIGKRL